MVTSNELSMRVFVWTESWELTSDTHGRCQRCGLIPNYVGHSVDVVCT